MSNANSAMSKKDDGTGGGQDALREPALKQTYAMAVQKQPPGSDNSALLDSTVVNKDKNTSSVSDRNLTIRYKIVKLRNRKVRLEYLKQLVRLVANTMAVYAVHDHGNNKLSCDMWNRWSLKGFTNPANDIHEIASIIEFPKNQFKNLKSVGQHMLVKIPILRKYIKFMTQSRDNAPICYVSKAKAIEDTSSSKFAFKVTESNVPTMDDTANSPRVLNKPKEDFRVTEESQIPCLDCTGPSECTEICSVGSVEADWRVDST